MATRPEDLYEPITVPPAGLLAATVGTPQAPLPPINPNVYEDDDVVAEVNRITSQDNDYMKLARTSGLQTANKRGLLNSSIAAGASQAAAIAAAAPLAGQNAQQRGNRNQERLSSYFTGQRQQAGFAQDTAMQERQLTAAEEQQAKEIEARLTMQGIDIASQREFQTNQLNSTRQLAELNIAAESDRLGRQLTAAEESQIRDLASRSSLLSTELASRETLARESIIADMERAQLGETNANLRANLDAATRVQLSEMSLLSEEQRAALGYYLESNKIYANSLDNLYGNKDMPSPARDAAIANFTALRNSGANLPSLLFGTSMDWGLPGTPGAGTGAPGTGVPTVPTVPLPAAGSAPATTPWTGPTPAQIQSMNGDGKSGGYGYASMNAAVAAYNTWAKANNAAPMNADGSLGEAPPPNYAANYGVVAPVAAAPVGTAPAGTAPVATAPVVPTTSGGITTSSSRGSYLTGALVPTGSAPAGLMDTGAIDQSTLDFELMQLEADRLAGNAPSGLLAY